MSIINTYFQETNSLQNKYGIKSIVLMQVGSFYEVYGYKNTKTGNIYGSNIIEFIQICDFNMSEKKGVKGQESHIHVLMAGFPDYQIEKYIQKLQQNNFTVAIYNQHKAGKGFERTLDLICSPGTYFNIEDNEHDTGYTICIRLLVRDKNKINKSQKTYIGISLLNIITGETRYSEVCSETKTDPSTYDFLERIISIYTPQEYICIYSSDEYNIDELNNVLSCVGLRNVYGHNVNLHDTNSQFSISALKCEKQTYQFEIFNQYFKPNDIDFFFEQFDFYEKSLACQSLVFLLDFMYEHNPKLIHKLKYPLLEFESNDMYLANHSLKQLNIISDNLKTHKHNSVLNLLNQAITPMGKRKFKQMLLHPITNVNLLEKRYTHITDSLQHIDTIKKIRAKLRNIVDIQKIIRALHIGRYNFKHILQIYNSILDIHEVFQLICEIKKDNKTVFEIQSCTDSLCHILEFLRSEYNLQYGTIQFEANSDDIEGYMLYSSNYFLPNQYEELDIIQKEWITTVEKIHGIRDYLSNIISKQTKQSKITQNACKIQSMEKTGYYFKTTTTRCKLLKDYFNSHENSRNVSYTSKLTNINHFFSIKGEFTFTQCTGNEKRINHEETDKLQHEAFKLRDSFYEKQESCLKKSVEKLKSYSEHIEHVIQTVSYIDAIFGNVIHSREYNYCCPQIHDCETSFLEAIQIRHPLIEVIQKSETFVANDILLNSGSEGMLIFGTNAVGKSSLIKAVGICVILAQAGFYVPCTKFTYKPFQKIFTRILGNDNLFKGLSTFAVEMSELNTILKHACENSLVLGDELCSGTELGSAISIFVAGLIHLHKTHVKHMFATHFHEITNMKELTTMSTLKFKHLAVEYDQNTCTLIYNRSLQDGPGNNLYGLEVCKSMLLPKSFLETANNIRLRINPSQNKISDRGVSRYNSDKIKINCEICNGISEDIHHLKYQMYSDTYGFIDNIPVHHKANLLSLCKSCHDSIHSSKKQYRKTKTTDGILLREI